MSYNFVYNGKGLSTGTNSGTKSIKCTSNAVIYISGNFQIPSNTRDYKNVVLERSGV